MPKMKTKSAAKKRFKITATGKVQVGRGRQAPRHDQASNKFIRNARGTMVLAKRTARRSSRITCPTVSETQRFGSVRRS